MDLGSPPVNRPRFPETDPEEMDQTLVSSMIETLVTNVTNSAIDNQQEEAARTPPQESEMTVIKYPEATPQFSPALVSPSRAGDRADGGMSPMNTASAEAANFEVSALGNDSDSAQARTLKTGETSRDLGVEDACKSVLDSSAAEVKVEDEPVETHMKAGPLSPFAPLPQGALRPEPQPLPVQQVASQIGPSVTQRQQVALLSCMLQHFAAAVPKTLLQMQENYGIQAKESVSWLGQHPLQLNPLSSEVA